MNLYEKIDYACEQNPDKKYIDLTDTDSGLMKNKGIPQDYYNVEAISNNQIIVCIWIQGCYAGRARPISIKTDDRKTSKLLQVWEGG